MTRGPTSQIAGVPGHQLFPAPHPAAVNMNTAHRAAPGTDSQKTGAADAPKPLDAGAVTKRLQQELMSLMVGGDQGISAFPDGDSLFSWVGTITVRRRGAGSGAQQLPAALHSWTPAKRQCCRGSWGKAACRARQE